MCSCDLSGGALLKKLRLALVKNTNHVFLRGVRLDICFVSCLAKSGSSQPTNFLEGGVRDRIAVRVHVSRFAWRQRTHRRDGAAEPRMTPVDVLELSLHRLRGRRLVRPRRTDNDDAARRQPDLRNGHSLSIRHSIGGRLLTFPTVC